MDSAHTQGLTQPSSYQECGHRARGVSLTPQDKNIRVICYDVQHTTDPGKEPNRMEHPTDYARLAENMLQQSEGLDGVYRDAKLKEAEIWARLAQASAIVHAAKIQIGE